MLSEKHGLTFIIIAIVTTFALAFVGGVFIIIGLIGYLFPSMSWIYGIEFTEDTAIDRTSWYSFFTETAGWPVCHLLMNFIGFFFTTSWTLVFVKYPFNIYWKRNLIFWSLAIFQLVTFAVIWEIFEACIKSGTVVASNMNINGTIGAWVEFFEDGFYETVNNIILSDLLMPFITSVIGIILVEIGAIVPPTFLLLDRNGIFCTIRVIWITAIGWIEFLHVISLKFGVITFGIGWWVVLCLKIAMFGICYIDDAIIAKRTKKGLVWLNTFYIYFYSLIIALWVFGYIDFRGWGYGFYVWVYPMALAIGVIHTILTFIVAIFVKLKIFMGWEYMLNSILDERIFREKNFNFESILCPVEGGNVAEKIKNVLSFGTSKNMTDFNESDVENFNKELIEQL